MPAAQAVTAHAWNEPVTRLWVSSVEAYSMCHVSAGGGEQRSNDKYNTAADAHLWYSRLGGEGRCDSMQLNGVLSTGHPGAVRCAPALRDICKSCVPGSGSVSGLIGGRWQTAHVAGLTRSQEPRASREHDAVAAAL
jgi:hypothetical protein